MIETLQSRARARRENKDGGYVLVLIAVALPVLLLVIGFAVDLGSWYLSASRLQRAADSAALAAAISLPDPDQALINATDAYSRNGYVNGQKNIVITSEATSVGFKTNIQNTKVRTYFVQSVLKSISLSRSSFSVKHSTDPVLGSPFNVLGTGDLDMGKPKQNFWLAINGTCSPKEDGDYFNASQDGNKVGFGSTTDAQHNYDGSNAHHECPGGNPNPDHDPSGYSYFIDVPPTASGDVQVMVYDPANFTDPVKSYVQYPDKGIDLGKDVQASNSGTVYDLLDTNGDPDDFTNDTELIDHPFLTKDNDTRDVDNFHDKWWLLGTIPNSRIQAGGTFRVHVFTQNENKPQYRSINSFSIGAFPSWIAGGAVQACDTRDLPLTCPRVYARNAMSVYNSLTGVGTAQPEFYFAKIDPGFVGQTFDLQFWDPGEGVSKIEILGPDGTPLTFNWDTTPGGPGYSGASATSIQTDLDGPPAYGQSLSNTWKFNDRLLTISLTVPTDYPQMVAKANGSDWLRVRYTAGVAATDRQTVGMNIKGGVSGAAKLTRAG